MKKLRYITGGLFIGLLVSISAFAQTPPTKIAVIDTRGFDGDKPGTGITKYVNGMNTLDGEFKPVDAEIQGLATRYQNLASEIKNLQAAPTPNVPLIQTKAAEYSKLERDIKFKQEDAKARYQSRYNVVMGPILQEIGKAMQDDAKQKGYMLILDNAKLDEAQLILAASPEVDVTKDFIIFFNARPATATVPPK